MGFEDSDSWHWTLALLNLVTLLDSVTHGFWTLTLWTLSLHTPAPHPEAERELVPLSNRLPRN